MTRNILRALEAKRKTKAFVHIAETHYDFSIIPHYLGFDTTGALLHIVAEDVLIIGPKILEQILPDGYKSRMGQIVTPYGATKLDIKQSVIMWVYCLQVNGVFMSVFFKKKKEN